LSSKEQKIQDLEKALVDRDEASTREVSAMKDKLKLLFEEYVKALREFGVRPAPLTASAEFSEFMKRSLRHFLGSFLVQVTSPPHSQLEVS
jgi:hypothetical protein